MILAKEEDFFDPRGTRECFAEAEKISYEIAKKIQDEMTYPGQVKVTVIRETRAINYAK